MLIPKLNLKKFSIEENVDHSFITDVKTGNKVRLESTESMVLKCIDGVKSLNEIKQEVSALLPYEIGEESVFRALDRLSDIGILKKRLLPPVGGQVSSRRQFLAKAAGTLALGAAAVSPVAFAGNSALQQEERAKRAKEKDQKKATKELQKEAREQERKRSQEENRKRVAEQVQKNKSK